MKSPKYETLILDKIVGGGQALGTLSDGRKAFVWGGLPGETVTIRLTKTKSHMVEGVVTEVINTSKNRVPPEDPDSCLSTSPWQIIDFSAEQNYKATLINEAFILHGTTLPGVTKVYTDGSEYHYRNKVEFSWYSDATPSGDTLDLAFFKRGGKGKVVVAQCALLPACIMELALQIRDILHKNGISARQLKTLLIRCNQQGACAWQLYVKGTSFSGISNQQAAQLPAQGGEIIYSDPKSPASRITRRLQAFGETTLTDTILGVPFRYATESFFQINVPVYEQALRDMREWVISAPKNELSKETHQPGRGLYFTQDSKPPEVEPKESSDETLGSAAIPLERERYLEGNGAQKRKNGQPPIDNDGSGEDKDKDNNSTLQILDLYSGVGTIGLTIGGRAPELVEVNPNAVREMQRNITALHSNATAILAPSEKALDYITGDKLIIVDPPRAGLHADVINRLLATAPPRIIYLSCNPVTQARDVALLAQKYTIAHHQGYNFFPRTPHIEHLVVLDRTH